MFERKWVPITSLVPKPLSRSKEGLIDTSMTRRYGVSARITHAIVSANVIFSVLSPYTFCARRCCVHLLYFAFVPVINGDAERRPTLIWYRVFCKCVVSINNNTFARRYVWVAESSAIHDTISGVMIAKREGAKERIGKRGQFGNVQITSRGPRSAPSSHGAQILPPSPLAHAVFTE